MKFHCYACRNQFEATHFNVARITISCPTCCTELHIAQSLARVYGKVAGEQISKIMESLERVCSRGKENLTQTIDLTYFTIKRICEEARV